jgi:hypothetical protein
MLIWSCSCWEIVNQRSDRFPQLVMQKCRMQNYADISTGF